MPDTTLQDVHRLQKADIGAGNDLLLRFVRNELELPFDVESVELRPSAVSLNSINGVVQTSAGRKFFKTHIEPASVIGEYYNVALLTNAGYPIVAPVFASTAYGRQFLIYDWFEAPSLFESILAVETTREREHDLLEAVEASDHRLFELYANSFCTIDTETHAKQPVHQLFLHRLAGARYGDFYSGDFVLPDSHIPFAELAAKNWVVNGVAYRDTLKTMVARAANVLRFAADRPIPVVTGHGDAHAGNLLFLGPQEPLTYFDPAFAGTHSPLLDVIKPFIHDSLLKWLYFPDDVAAGSAITWRLTGDTIAVEHDFSPTAVRMALFESKLNRVVAPMLKFLKSNAALPANWQSIMQAAAMCCPLLTMNLADRNRFKPEVALLGLSMTVELGGCGCNPVRPGWLERRLQAVAPQ